MTAFQKMAEAMLYGSPTQPEAPSAQDLAAQTSFAKLVTGQMRISAVDAYAAYETSMGRENTFAALTGARESEIVSFEDFLELIGSLQHEIDAGIWICIAANRRRLH